jgi:hypothetical protein
MQTSSPVVKRPRIGEATEFGNASNFWVEYENGLVDLTRSQHLDPSGSPPGAAKDGQWDIPCEGERTIRVDARATAVSADPL